MWNILKYILVFSCLGLLFSACNENKVFKEYIKNFPKYRWEKERELVFEPIIADTISPYNLYLSLRHVHGFQFAEVRVALTRISPSGDTTSSTYTFPTLGSDGKYLSDCAEDICDLEVMVESGLSLKEMGEYKFVIRHLMPIETVPNVMEFGLILEKDQDSEV